MKQLLESKFHIESMLVLDLTFVKSDKSKIRKNIKIAQGDKVLVQFWDGKNTITDKGVVTAIQQPTVATRRGIQVNPLSGQLEPLTPYGVPVIEVDASKNYRSNKLTIAANRILDISHITSLDAADVPSDFIPDDVTPNPDIPVNAQSVSWTTEPIEVPAGEALLKVPYVRTVPGTIDLTIANGDNLHVYFKERFVASTANLNASFTWSMRDISAIASEITADMDLLVENGMYIFRNGDESKELVMKYDRDNSLIIPVGTEIVVTLTLTDKDDDVETISKRYIVKQPDVDAVKL